MSRVTSKRQVTMPKAVADRFGIRPGDEIEWEGVGSVIHVIPPGARRQGSTAQERLKAFDEATARQRRRQGKPSKAVAVKSRGWRREDVYARARPR